LSGRTVSLAAYVAEIRMPGSPPSGRQHAFTLGKVQNSVSHATHRRATLREKRRLTIGASVWRVEHGAITPLLLALAAEVSKETDYQRIVDS